MKTKLFNFIIIGTLLVTGVVSAQAEAFSTPVHTGGYEQKKEGSFVASFLKAGLKVLPANIPSLAGFIIADKVISSPQGFFNTVILPVNKKGDKTLEPQLRIGTSSNDLINTVFKNDAPVTIDLVGRNTKDAIALLADPTKCTPNVSVISTNTSAFHFWSGANNGGNNDNADIIARQIQLSGGNPGAGKILISVDGQGSATWATVKVDKNGNATYEYETSPIMSGLCEDVVTPQDFCPNLTGGPYTKLPTNTSTITWAKVGNSCIPSSCEESIINTKERGETIVKGTNCINWSDWKIVDRFLNSKGEETSPIFSNIGANSTAQQAVEIINGKLPPINKSTTCKEYFGGKPKYGDQSSYETQFRVVGFGSNYGNFNDRRWTNDTRRDKIMPLASFMPNIIKRDGIQNDYFSPGLRDYTYLTLQGSWIPTPKINGEYGPVSDTNKSGIKGIVPNSEGKCLYQAMFMYQIEPVILDANKTLPASVQEKWTRRYPDNAGDTSAIVSQCVVGDWDKVPEDDSWGAKDFKFANFVNGAPDFMDYPDAQKFNGNSSEKIKAWKPVISCSNFEKETQPLEGNRPGVNSNGFFEFVKEYKNNRIENTWHISGDSYQLEYRTRSK